MRGWSLAVMAAACCVAPAASAGQGGAEARCEALAGGFEIKKEDAAAALTSCTDAQAARPNEPRLLYLKGKALFWSDRDAEAFAAQTAAAERGYAPALEQLGVMHQWGYGVPEDTAKAADLFRRALAGGDAFAAINLAWMHREGAGLPKDLKAAARYYRRAAAAGLPAGELGLGFAYETGSGVPRDLTRAVELYRRAAAKGDTDAQHNLGLMAAQGRGLPRDRIEAFRWYRLSAEGGGRGGMFNAGLAYLNGWGVSKDEAEGERWLRRGIAAGDELHAPNSLAYFMARTDRSLDEAAALAEGALKAAPDHPAVLDTLGLIRLRQNRLADAALLVRKSVVLEPTPLHHARLGDVYAAMGLRAEARTAWRRALSALRGPDQTEEITVDDLRQRLSAAP